MCKLVGFVALRGSILIESLIKYARIVFDDFYNLHRYDVSKKISWIDKLEKQIFIKSNSNGK